MSAEALHMVQLSLHGRQLGQLRRGDEPGHWADEGYKLHSLLGELFGEDAPGPFVVEQADARGLTLLAYSGLGLEALQESAQLSAAPNIYAACNWEASASKPMPVGFRMGAMLGFEVRVCPVVRLGRGAASRGGTPGAELDVFLHRAKEKTAEALAAGLVTREQIEDPYWDAAQHEACALDRGQVYAQWLAERLTQQGGARVAEASMTSFQLAKLQRRAHDDKRSRAAMVRPDVVLHGTLEVSDPERFVQLLRGGVGRHCAFGFGMLKLKRAAR
jgi:CRISPR system Cascade subunit CasE